MNRKRIILPGEVADGIHFLCSDAARAITGISMPIDGGWLSRVTCIQHPGWPPKDRDPDTAQARATTHRSIRPIQNAHGRVDRLAA